MIQVQGYYVLACAMWIYMREETNEMPIKPYEKRLIFNTFSFYIGRMLNTRSHVVCGSDSFCIKYIPPKPPRPYSVPYSRMKGKVIQWEVEVFVQL